MARTPGSKNKPKDGATVKTTRKKSLDTKIKEANKKIEDLKAKLEAAEKDLKDLEDEKETAAEKAEMHKITDSLNISLDEFKEKLGVKDTTEQV